MTCCILACSTMACTADFPADGGDLGVGPADANRIEGGADAADAAGFDAGEFDAASGDAHFGDAALSDARVVDSDVGDAQPGDAQPRPDASRPDLGPEPDLGPDLDAEPEPDLGPVPDLGPEPDLGFESDLGLDPDADPGPDADPLPDADLSDAILPMAEICNGLDDDFDLQVDEGQICGPFVAESCEVILAWSDVSAGPRDGWDGEPAPQWAGCPPGQQDNGGSRRCASSAGDGRFHGFQVEGDMNFDDQLGIALICDGPDPDGVGAWVEAHCAVFLTHADSFQSPDEGSATWGPCPEAIAGGGAQDPQRCTSSGFDRLFRPMNLVGNVDENDRFGLAWICEDPDDPDRAAALESSVEAFIGWADDDRHLGGGALDRADFDGCPGSSRDDEGKVRCVGTAGDGLFHWFTIGDENVGNRFEGFFDRHISIFSVAFRARP